jgi:hypothetical protein
MALGLRHAREHQLAARPEEHTAKSLTSEADLDGLERGQQNDGGWTFDWLEWCTETACRVARRSDLARPCRPPCPRAPSAVALRLIRSGGG